MKHRLFLFLILLLVLWFFKNAFGVGFFKDDFYFLNVSHANSVNDFLNFFNPFKTYGFRPIPIELFYFSINRFNLGFFAIHVIMFTVFFIGLVFLFKSILKLSQNELFAKITVLLYAIHLTHVFQLYAAWNFQEVCLFAFLNLSFYCLLIKRYLPSIIFFVAALLSKENAIFFLPLVVGVALLSQILKLKYRLKIKPVLIAIFAGITLVFLFIYKYELSKFAENPLYVLHWNPKLILNNLVWYGLWALGLPSYLPDYMTSIFSPPLPDFYKDLATLESRLYFYLLLVYTGVFIAATAKVLLNPKNRKQLLILGLFCFGFFFLFNSSTLPMIHKWMVRLTVPLIFLSLFQGAVITKLFQGKKLAKFVAVFLLSLYVVWNYYGTIVHESASTIKLESAIYFKSRELFNNARQEILTKDYIFIKDLEKRAKPWGGSQKLNDTYWGQNFVQYLFPEKKLVMLYNFETKKIPKNSFVVQSIKLLPN